MKVLLEKVIRNWNIPHVGVNRFRHFRAFCALLAVRALFALGVVGTENVRRCWESWFGRLRQLPSRCPNSPVMRP